MTMLMLIIAGKKLYKATLSLKDERIKGISIFPFFDTSGDVKQLMILLPGLDKILMIPFKKGIISVSFLGRLKLSMDLPQLMSYSDFTGKQIENLYHYDPDWALSHERFTKHWAQQLIKQTNCLNLIKEKVTSLRFSRDLSLLEGFAVEAGYLNTASRTIKPEKILLQLHKAESEQSDYLIRPANREWQLSPQWNEWGKF